MISSSGGSSTVRSVTGSDESSRPTTLATWSPGTRYTACAVGVGDHRAEAGELRLRDGLAEPDHHALVGPDLAGELLRDPRRR